MNAIDRYSTAYQALESVQRAVVKIGGDNACRFRQNADRAEQRLEQGLETILVISAIRSSNEDYSVYSHELVASNSENQREQGFNTTTHLLGIAGLLEPENPDKHSALEIADRIEQFTIAVMAADLEGDEETVAVLSALIKEQGSVLKDQISTFNPSEDKLYHIGEDIVIKKADGSYFSITGFGELLAQAVYLKYFERRGINVGEVDTNKLSKKTFANTEDVSKSFKDRLWREKRIDKVSAMVGKEVSGVLDKAEAPMVLIAAGYCPALASNRGYTELLAAVILAELIKKTESQVRTALLVEKSVRGVLNANPQALSNPELAKTVELITWKLAHALFGAEYGADAGVIQSDAIYYLEAADADAFVFDPDNVGEGKVTHVCKREVSPKGVEIIQPRKGAIFKMTYSGPRLEGEDREAVQSTFKAWAKKRDLMWVDKNSDQQGTTRILAGDSSQAITGEDIAALKAQILEEHQLGDNRVQIEYNPNISLMSALGNNMSKPQVATRANAALDVLGINRLDLGQVGQQALWFAVDSKREQEITNVLHTLLVTTTEEVFWQKFRENKLKDLLSA